MIERKLVESLIGKTFADNLDSEIFHLGATAFTKREMVEELACANFIAAARLEKALKKLDIKTPAQLFKLDPFSLIRIRGIGEAAIFVAMCVLEHAGHDIKDWWGWQGNTRKFNSFKRSSMKRARKNKHEI